MNIIKRVIDLCKKALGKKSKPPIKPETLTTPIVYTRAQHPVSRQLISPNAQKVLYRLSNAGYDAYLVGGGVRDILLGIEPKDFDIATNATPEQIKALFRNCRLIGRRFRLAHIIFGRELIEVATFRGHHENASEAEQNCQKTSKQSEHGMLLRDNIYGSIEEDAERRDFSINALYYNIKDFNIYDFANGVSDINDRIIRLIGDPETRYREDPVRMLRAIRFAAKLNMQMSAQTSAPIVMLAELLANIPAARMFEEFNKMFLSGQAVATFTLLREYQLFKYFFPSLDRALADAPDNSYENFVRLAMHSTDQRIKNEQRVTPGFLLSVMLWQPLQLQIQQLKIHSSLSAQDIFFAALHETTAEQQASIAIPKRFQALMKDIWILQDKLSRRDGKRAFKILEHPKFRAGYDFLLLRAEVEQGETLALAKWWTDFQTASPDTQLLMVKSIPQGHAGRRSTGKRRKPRQRTIDEIS